MFALRFPPDEIQHWAQRYVSYPEEERLVTTVAPQIRRQQFVTREQLINLCRWKSPRIQALCAQNRSAFIESVAYTALTTPDEQLRIEVLTLLSGVSWPMASVILHWGHLDDYPILDFRALWSVGVDSGSIAYTFDCWWKYTLFCRQLAHGQGVSMRILDRALWQFSKERQ